MGVGRKLRALAAGAALALPGLVTTAGAQTTSSSWSRMSEEEQRYYMESEQRACEAVTDARQRASCLRQLEARVRSWQQSAAREQQRREDEEAFRRRDCAAVSTSFGRTSCEKTRETERLGELDRQAAAAGRCEDIKSPVQRSGCQDARRRREGVAQTLAAGRFLGGEELRRLVRGKTVEARPEPVPGGPPNQGDPITVFYGTGGDAYYRRGMAGFASRFRGKWELDAAGECVRIVNSGTPCAAFQQMDDGTVRMIYRVSENTLFAYRAVVSDGDVAGTVQELEKWRMPGEPATRPAAASPAGTVPAGTRTGQPPAGVLGPSMR